MSRLLHHPWGAFTDVPPAPLRVQTPPQAAEPAAWLCSTHSTEDGFTVGPRAEGAASWAEPLRGGLAELRTLGSCADGRGV